MATPNPTVYGTLLNDRSTIERLSSQFDQPPYKAAPVAPVLYIKPRNTLRADGAAVTVPADAAGLRVEATIGAVIGRTATRVSEAEALSHVEGYVIASDLSVPHDLYYRPSIKHRCRDGFCPMGEVVRVPGFDVANARLNLSINGEQVLSRDFSNMVRPIAKLLADVTEFMTLEAGDILLLGLHEGSPTAQAGDSIRIEVPGLGSLSHTLVAEAA